MYLWELLVFHCISAAYRVVELIFRDEYTLLIFRKHNYGYGKIGYWRTITTVTGGLVTAALTGGTSIILVTLGVFYRF